MDLLIVDMAAVVSLWIFIGVMVGTPGPANLLMMTVGSRFGVMAAMPFNLGLVFGKFSLNIAMAIGVGVVLSEQTATVTTFKFISAGIMIYLSMRTLGRARDTQDQTEACPGFLSGIIVHPLNPKAWVMTVLAWSEFGPELGNIVQQTIVICTSFALAQLILHGLWAAAGRLLSQALGQSVWLNRFLVLLTCSVVLWAVLI